MADAFGWSDRRSCTNRVVIVSFILGPQHLHHLSRYGSAEESRKLGGSVCVDNDRATARMGALESQRSWLPVNTTRKVSFVQRVLACVHSFSDRNDRFLGHAVIEYA